LISRFRRGYNKYWKARREFPLVLFKQQLPVIDVNFFKRNLQMKSLVLVAMFAIALSACGKKEEAKPVDAAPAAPAAAPADAAPAAAPAAPAADVKK